MNMRDLEIMIQEIRDAFGYALSGYGVYNERLGRE